MFDNECFYKEINNLVYNENFANKEATEKNLSSPWFVRIV
jgi:hypothetical protein